MVTPEFRNDNKDINDLTYLNTIYKNERSTKRVLNIDSGSFTNGDTTTTFTLDHAKEHVSIKTTDIFLDLFLQHLIL